MRQIDYRELKMNRHKNLKMLRKLERKDSKTLKNKMPKMKLISKRDKRRPN